MENNIAEENDFDGIPSFEEQQNSVNNTDFEDLNPKDSDSENAEKNEDLETKDLKDNSNNKDLSKESKESEKSEDSEESKESEESEESTGFEDLTEQLMNIGVLKLNPEKEYENSIDGFSEIIEDTLAQRFESTIKESVADEKSFTAVSLLLEGRNLEEVIEIFSSSEDDVNSWDFSSEETQKYAIAKVLELDGFSEERILSKLKTYEEKGILESEASDAAEKLKLIQEENRNNKINELKLSNEKIEEEKRIQEQAFRATILESEEIGGYSIPYEDRKKFADYLTKPHSNGYTKAQLDMQEDPEILLLAQFFKMKGRNIGSLLQSAKIEATNKTIGKLKETLGQAKPSTSNKNATSRGNQEIFDFSAFNIS